MRYAELHCKTNYSFLEAAAHPDELAKRAQELGYAALAVTDRDSLAGIVRAHVAAKEVNLKLIIGAEMHPCDAPPVVLWVTDRKSYGRLCRLITLGRRRAEKGHCDLAFADIAAHSDGLLAGIIPLDDFASSQRFVVAFREVFGDRVYILAELFKGPDDAQRLHELQVLSRSTKVPLIAANNVHYHVRERLPLHDVLTAIRHGTTVAAAGDKLFANAERHLRSLDEIAAAFAECPAAVARTMEVADRCTFNLDELKYEYPEELVPPGRTPTEYLAELTWHGAAERYPGGLPPKVQSLIEHELALIGQLRYEAYFLTVHDLVHVARSKDILCQGRGSAANSAVCYCLGVTSVDPEKIEVLFERFISAERDEAPDIDIDFEHERRDEMLQYLYSKYSRDRAGLAATVITYCVRSAVRDVGKALGFSLDRVDALAQQVEGYHGDRLLAERCAQVGIDPQSTIGGRLLFLVNEILGFPRHLSQHVGGMVMTRGPLCELAVIENAAMPERTVVQWDKNDLEALGILKVDVLALGMLTAIRKCFALVEQHYGRSLTLATVPQDDAAVYEMMCRADTIGVFQIESRGQMSMLPRLQPKCFYDLVIEVAILRPGPIQGDMVHPFLRRRHGVEPVTYPSEALRPVLERTLGVPLFQEQALRIAMIAANFSGGEADQLRRAMASWGRNGVIEKFRDRFMQGMSDNQYDPATAEKLFAQLLGYSGYGFPESHSASFALLVYVSAYLKHYYPAAFTCSLLNSQPMGFYEPAQLIQCARRHGVAVRPIDVNHSAYDCLLEPTSNGLALRLGFRLVNGIRHDAVEAIAAARADGEFQSLSDFTRRTSLTRPTMETLADADAFGSLHMTRRAALWHALAQERKPAGVNLFAGVIVDESCTPLPDMASFDEVIADYRTTGYSLKGHPVGFYREQLNRLHVVPAQRLTDMTHGDAVIVAGIVLLRQRPGTAKGITFVTLEDETDVANLIVHQSTWDRYYTIARRCPAWIAHGRLERKDSVIHVIVKKLEAMSARVGDAGVKSRDFR